jgi:hypothetical protein
MAFGDRNFVLGRSWIYWIYFEGWLLRAFSRLIWLSVAQLCVWTMEVMLIITTHDTISISMLLPSQESGECSVMYVLPEASILHFLQLYTNRIASIGCRAVPSNPLERWARNANDLLLNHHRSLSIIKS